MTSKVDEAIRQNATQAVYERGYGYYDSGAVGTVVRRGQTLFAEVEGSGYEPYQVNIALAGDTIEDADCSCPYAAEWGGWCKHIVAALLAFDDASGTVVEEAPLAKLVAPLERAQLLELIEHLAERLPATYDITAAWLEVRAVSTPTKSKKGSEKTVLDPQPFRRRVSAALHSLDRMRDSEAYWHVGGVVNEVRGILEEAQTLIEASDGNNALLVLEAITDEYVNGWYELDDSNGECGEFFSELDRAWTEALLIADLDDGQRNDWQKCLKQWQREIEDYGDISFETALAAARDGWKPVKYGDEIPWYAGDLATAKLNILERQGKFEEALKLAEAEGQHARHAILLARLGRKDDAATAMRKQLRGGEELLEVARALEANGGAKVAMRAVADALAREQEPVEYGRAALAAWLRDVAAAHDETALALQGAREVVLSAPTLGDYEKAHELAGDAWPPLREELLKLARGWKSYDKAGAVNILLHENENGAALKLIKDSHDYVLLARVAEAASKSHPREVIALCRQQAESIMDAKKSDAYGSAVQWLRRAKTAYQNAGQMAEWQEYLEGLIAKHTKKYKLRPMLEALR